MKTITKKIYGQDWTIRFVKRHKIFKTCTGWVNPIKNEIIIDNKLPESQQKSIVLHELLHIVANANDIDLTEKDVNALESGLFSVIDFELR